MLTPIKSQSHILRSDPKLLSVIVPAYNCKTILDDLASLNQSLTNLHRPYEIICVVDGRKNKSDNTLELAKQNKNRNTKIFDYPINRGKGYAIRFGMARAKGGIIAFIDAGSDLNATGIELALREMKLHHADIVIGSKRHKDSKVAYPWRRKVLSWIVQKATRLFFGLKVSDTQTGLKIFKRQVLVKVLPRLLVKRWAFDLEILSVANRLGFKKIFESPVELNYNFSSNVDMAAIKNFATDYMAIIYRIYFLHYYDDKYEDRWGDDPDLVLKYK